MIEASFDRMSRRAAIDGVYQYDTGQRLRINGLPSPIELGAKDEFIDGDIVTVQVHFGYIGDAQTESRLAQWQAEDGCWLVEIPDEYLTRSEAVHVYIYVYHGETEAGARAHTMYEGVFTPAYRPAPNTVASDDMLSQWNELAGEVDVALASATTSIDNISGYADSANAAAQAALKASTQANASAENAEDAVDRLEAVEQRWAGMTVRTKTLPAGYASTAELSGNVLTLGLPVGANGAKGATGDTGPADIGLSISDGVLTITPR